MFEISFKGDVPLTIVAGSLLIVGYLAPAGFGVFWGFLRRWQHSFRFATQRRTAEALRPMLRANSSMIIHPAPCAAPGIAGCPYRPFMR
jgi:hypothetical protein